MREDALGYASFPDLFIQRPGCYRIRISLLRMPDPGASGDEDDEDEDENEDAPAAAAAAVTVASVDSAAFRVVPQAAFGGASRAQ